ncbi:MAG: transposase [candidate division Zixibacteria bacterium]|nr:transposase [candidate division Zixibacteria bacterium]
MRLKHYDHDGRARFITFCTHKRLPILENSDLCTIVQEQLFDICRTECVDILAFVIMPDHLHAVFVPPVTMKLGLFVGEFKRQTAKTILARLREVRPQSVPELEVMRDGTVKYAVWQRRCFDRNCRSEDEVWQAVEYCHFNPVARGLVADPADWKWSSYNWYADE